MKRSSHLGPSGPRCEAGQSRADTEPSNGPRTRPKRVRIAGPRLAILAIAELAWLLWFLIVPLPNANNVGSPPKSPVRRGWLLLKTFPEVVPDTPFRRVASGARPRGAQPPRKPSQRVPIVLAAGLIAAAAIGVGDMVLRGLAA